MGSLGTWDLVKGISGVVCIHTFLLPDQRLLCMERFHQDPFPQNGNTGGHLVAEIQLREVGGSLTAEFTPRPVTSDPFCAGHAQMPDGSVLVVGGDDRPAPFANVSTVNGLKGVRKYWPCGNDNCTSAQTGEWEDLYEMSTGRWYPTVATLSNGNAIIISGSSFGMDFGYLDQPGLQNPTYEYYPPKEGNWPRDLEILRWAFPFMLYPMVFQLPSGGVFLFVANRTVIIDPETDELSSPIPDLTLGNSLPMIYPFSPTMVMLPLSSANGWKSTLLLCGGSYYDEQGVPIGSPKCFKISPDDANPRWEEEEDMPEGRVMPNGVLLPDGKVLFVNGASWGAAGGSNGGDTVSAGDPVYRTSVYDPEGAPGQKWTELAVASEARLYHSGALLNHDGTVLTMGSEFQNYVDTQGPNALDVTCYPATEKVCTDPYNYNIERYTPYYLQTDKPRPVLVSAPSSITYQSTMIVRLASSVQRNGIKASLMRYATTTHNTDTDQRLLQLDIVRVDGDELTLELPPNGRVAPPGNYMLFIVQDGVPSVSTTIRLTAGKVVTAVRGDGVTGDSGATNTSRSNDAGTPSSVLSIAWVLLLSCALLY